MSSWCAACSARAFAHVKDHDQAAGWMDVEAISYHIPLTGNLDGSRVGYCLLHGFGPARAFTQQLSGFNGELDLGCHMTG